MCVYIGELGLRLNDGNIHKPAFQQSKKLNSDWLKVAITPQ